MKANIVDIQKIYASIPKRYEVNGQITDNYDLLTERHTFDGWRDVVVEELEENQKHAESYVLENDKVVLKAIDMTNEELEIYESAKIKEYEEMIYSTQEGLFESARKRSLDKIDKNISDKSLHILEEDYLRREKVAFEIIKGTDSEYFITKDSIIRDANNDYTEQELDGIIQYYQSIYTNLKVIDSTLNINFPTGNETKLIKYAYFITIAAEIGRKLDSIMVQMIGSFRSTMLTFLLKKQFDKIERGFELQKEITNNTDIKDILGIYYQFKAL